MLIRPKLEHIRQLVKLGEQNVAESKHKDTYPYDEHFAHNYFKQLIENEHVYIRAISLDDTIHGYIIGAPFHHPWNATLWLGVNIIYVDQCCRGTKWAGALIDDAKEYAKQKGFKEVVMGDNAFDPDRTAVLFKRKGFTLIGNQYGYEIT
jgi:GNAT superfamily N-acetyltransferase